MAVTLLGVILALAWLLTLFRLRPFVLFNQAREASQLSKARKEPSAHPTVSVVIAARNEANHIRRTLESLKAQDYKNLEVIVIDDRSTDSTGAVIHAVQLQWPTLRFQHVHTLPPGWLGKNHALYLGASLSQGDWLLFTDADIYFQPDAITRALHYALAKGSDHLTIPPTMVHNRYGLGALVSLFSFNLMIVFRPHLTALLGPQIAVGVGAFNLISKAVYNRIGTHAAFRMRPDDDLFLGKQVKQQAFRQDFAPLSELIEVEWYPSVRAMMEGLEKNALTPFDFSITRMLVAVALAFVFYEGPFLGLLLASLQGKLAFLMAIVLMYLCYSSLGFFVPVKSRYFVSFPAVVPLFLYILLRALWLFLWRGGIFWRGTFYPKGELLKMRRKDH